MLAEIKKTTDLKITPWASITKGKSLSKDLEGKNCQINKKIFPSNPTINPIIIIIREIEFIIIPYKRKDE